MRRHPAWLLLAALPFAALQLHEAVSGRPLYVRDATTAWLPQAESFVHCVTSGSAPYWDPFTAFGRPLLADPRAAVLYPFTWLNVLLLPAHYYALFAIAHVALAVAGAALLARALGLSRAAAACAAAVWGASGPLLSLVAMWNHLAGAAWLPWIAWGFARLAERPTARRAALAAVPLALSLLVGSPETTALAALATAFVLAAAPSAAPLRTRALAAGGAALLGLSLAAAQWVPTLAMVGQSERLRYDRTRALVWSLHPAAAPEALVPTRWNDWQLTPAAVHGVMESREPFLRSIYLGAASVVLVAAALARRRRDLAAPLAMVVAGTLLALGRFTPLYELATGSLPVVRGFRFPVKAFVLTALGWSLLAGIGFDRLRAAGRRERAWAACAAAAVGAALVAVAAVTHGGSVPAFLQHWLLRPLPQAGASLPVAGVALAAAAVLVLRKSPPLAAVAVLACLDLTYRHWQLNPTADPGLWRFRPPVVDALDRSGLARTYVVDHTLDAAAAAEAHRLGDLPRGLSPHVATMLAMQETLLPPLGARWRVFGSFDKDIADFDPKEQAALRERFLAATPDAQGKLLRIAAVRNVVGVRPGPLADGAGEVRDLPSLFASPVRVARLDGARPRAYLVDGVRRGDGADALLDPAFDPDREAVVDGGAPRAPSGASAGTAAVTGFGCAAVQVTVDAPAPARLVLVDAYDGGWRAAVDGASVPVARTNVAFRSVEVPAGRHAVEWTYVPPGFRAGLVLSAVALAAWLALVRVPRARGESDATSR